MEQTEYLAKVLNMVEDSLSPKNTRVDIARLKAVCEAAQKVFGWYYIFGENNKAARDHLAHLGNMLQEAGYGFKRLEDNP